jgi:hypothetical protein
LYAAISQSFFQPNEADVGARVMHLEQCISSSQNLDAVPMQEVFSQLEAAFPRRGNTSEAREPAAAATRRKVSPPSSGERSSSADLLEDNRSPTASAVLPVLPVRSNDASPQYEKHDLRHWGIPDSVYALDRLRVLLLPRSQLIITSYERAGVKRTQSTGWADFTTGRWNACRRRE